MPTRLTAHVLDLVAGEPAAGMRIWLRGRSGGASFASVMTQRDRGRRNSPLLGRDERGYVLAGEYG